MVMSSTDDNVVPLKPVKIVKITSNLYKRWQDVHDRRIKFEIESRKLIAIHKQIMNKINELFHEETKIKLEIQERSNGSNDFGL